MKKLTFLIMLLSYCGYSQVGVGTAAPDSTLDIVATNPTGSSTTVDGILIPRVDRQRAQSMTGTLVSTMVYVNSIATGAAAGTAINITSTGFYYYDGSVWQKITAGANTDWTLTGNGGTTAGTNFIGTTDAVDFRIKTAGSDRWNISNANSGQLQSYSLGTAALPTYSFQGDPNTGIFSPAGGDILAVATNGTEKIRIEADGDVGIGVTPNASAKLDINAANRGLLIPNVALTARNAAGPITTPATSLMVYNTATAGTTPNNVIPGYYYWNGAVWVAFTGTGGNDWSINGNSGTTGANYVGTSDAVDFKISTAGTERARVLSGGQIIVNNTGAPAAGDRFSVYNTTTSDFAINGYSTLTGTGVFGQNTGTGHGVYGLSSGTGIATRGSNLGTGYGVYGSTAGTVGTGVFGVANVAAGIGTYGTSNGVGGTGVFGNASANTGIGLYAQATGNNGTGVFGYANANNGDGTYGEATQAGRYGVWGVNNNGTGIGVRGSSTGASGTGVYGNNSGATGFGVYGIQTQAARPGVYGINDSNTGYGVYGTSLGTSGIGVYGITTGATSNAVYGTSSGTSSAAIYGTSTGTSGFGVYGIQSQPGRFGVYGINNNATGVGVAGTTSGATGVGVNGTTTGVDATAVIGSSTGTNADGVYGQATGATGYGVWGVNNNGTGNGVVGTSTGTNSYGVSGISAGSNGTGVYGATSAATSSGVIATNTNATGTGIIATGNNLGGVYMGVGSGGAFNGNPYGSVAWATDTASGIGVAGTGNNETLTTIGTTGAGGAFTGNKWAMTGVATITGAGNDATDRGVLIGNYVSGGSTIDNVYVGARIGGVNYKILGTGGGSVSTTMKTSQGERILFAPESTENWFFDMGEVELINGKATVNLDPIFVETLSDSKPFKVFVQGGENTLGSIRITRNQAGKSFIVEDMGGASNGTVQFSVYGIWKGKEDLRMPELKPENKPKQYVAEQKKYDFKNITAKTKASPSVENTVTEDAKRPAIESKKEPAGKKEEISKAKSERTVIEEPQEAVAKK